MAVDAMCSQRGTCASCNQEWVLGRSDANAGLYGQFFCGACWDSWGDSDEEVDENVFPMTAENLADVQAGQIVDKRVGFPDRDRVVRYIGDYRDIIPAAEVSDSGHDWICDSLQNDGTGFSLWFGAQVLLDYMEYKYAGRLKGKRIVELGAGLGLPGIGMAQLGARVILTDTARVQPLLQCNIDFNFAKKCPSQTQHGSIEAASAPVAAVLNWGNQKDIDNILDMTNKLGGLDFVLASEISYNSSSFDSLLQTLYDLTSVPEAPVDRSQKQKGVACHITITQKPPKIIMSLARRPNEFEMFVEAIAQSGWTFTILEEVDIALRTGIPACSSVLIVQLKYKGSRPAAHSQPPWRNRRSRKYRKVHFKGDA